MGENQINLQEIRAQFSLVSFLQRLGHDPLRQSGGEHFYRSMLREGDRVPSFCVNDKLGYWYDHGLGKGGTIIDLAKAYWPLLEFKDAVAQLCSTMGEVQSSLPGAFALEKQLEIPLRFPSYMVNEDRALGGNDIISAYLSSRGILEVASKYIRELYYSVKPEGKNRISFAAAGWQNDLGGWEVRNATFKGCLGRKWINFYAGSPEKISLFEGMMDYLSYRVLHPLENPSALVLNSLSMLGAGLSKANEFAFVDIYFDHDEAGRKATQDIQENLPRATDRSALYLGFNDLNEKLQANSGIKKINLASETFNRRFP